MLSKKIVIVVISAIVLTGCTTTTTNTSTSSSTSSELTSPVNPDGNVSIVDYAINMKDFSFTPNQMSAEPGETLKVKLTNSGNMAHNLTLDELDVASGDVAPGQEKTIEITVPSDAAGKTFQFYCGIGSHRQFGQVGTLTVLSLSSGN